MDCDSVRPILAFIIRRSFFFSGCFRFLAFFFHFSLLYSALTPLTLENDKIVHRDEGLRRLFTKSVHSAPTKKAIDNDKIMHSERGHKRIFPTVFFVNLGWVRGVLVISLYFIIFPSARLARRQDATAALNANAPWKRRVRCLTVVKNSFPPVNTVRRLVLYLPSRRVFVRYVRVNGGGRFCGGRTFSLSCGPNVRSGPSCI